MCCVFTEVATHEALVVDGVVKLAMVFQGGRPFMYKLLDNWMCWPIERVAVCAIA